MSVLRAAVLCFVIMSADAIVTDYSTSSFEITSTFDENVEQAFWQVLTRDKATGETYFFKLLVEKVSSGTLWAKPGSYLQAKTSNASGSFSAPIISFDSLLILNDTVPFASLRTLPEDEAVLQTIRFVSYRDNPILVREEGGGLRIDITSNTALPHWFGITARYFFEPTTFGGRLLGPRDLKMDYRLSSSAPIPQPVGLATGWWGGGGTLPTNITTNLDRVWQIVSTAGTVGRIDWVCAVDAQAQVGSTQVTAPVLVRTRAARGTAGPDVFQFWGLFDARQSTEVVWDPQATVLLDVDSGSTGEGGSNVGVIVGATVGAIVGGILVALLIVVITKQRQKRRNASAMKELQQRGRQNTVQDMQALKAEMA